MKKDEIKKFLIEKKKQFPKKNIFFNLNCYGSSLSSMYRTYLKETDKVYDSEVNTVKSCVTLDPMFYVQYTPHNNHNYTLLSQCINDIVAKIDNSMTMINIYDILYTIGHSDIYGHQAHTVQVTFSWFLI